MDRKRSSKKMVLFFSVIALVLTLSFVAIGCSNKTEEPQPDVYYIVSFDSNGGSHVDYQNIKSGGKVARPTNPEKSGFDFKGWYTTNDYSKSYDFENDTVTANTKLFAKWTEIIETVVKTITWDRSNIVLNENNLYVNENLADNQLSEYSFKTLQEAIAYADNGEDGTEQNPIKVYLEPNVYWTDNPDDPDKRERDNLIGLKIMSKNVTLIGMSNDASDVIIAGNRGQQAGANGNWNTLGASDGFKAYNITLGNYCNEDLIYKLDPSKNREKRQINVTQAQVIIPTSDEIMDKWVFENVRFISHLNTMSNAAGLNRVYFYKCVFQSTDDAINIGKIAVYEDCRFTFFSPHPVGSNSPNLQAYLNCFFDIQFKESNQSLYFAKGASKVMLVDNRFVGNATGFEWANDLPENLRMLVHNNKFNNAPFNISESKPEYTVEFSEEELKAVKVNNEYNIYNLMRGDDDWDVKNQKSRMKDYADIAYRMDISSPKSVVEFNEEIELTAFVQPSRVAVRDLTWAVSNNSALQIVTDTTTNKVTVKGINTHDFAEDCIVTATDDYGLQASFVISCNPSILDAPTFTVDPTILTPASGIVELSYAIDISAVALDYSDINWYKSIDGTMDNAVHVGQTSLNNPYKNYNLTKADVGYYLIATIAPQSHRSLKGEVKTAFSSSKIVDSDVANNDIYTDFANIVLQDTLQDDLWYADKIRPVDYSDEFKWDIGTTPAWEYGRGSDGAKDKIGLMTATRGARLLYNQSGEFSDSSLVVNLSPHKSAGQGFGSATGQYMDIYIKYDATTQTGYGLRIQRLTNFGDAVSFALCEFNNGVTTLLTPQDANSFSSAYMPGCKVELSVISNVISAKVTTTSAQSVSQLENNHPVDITLSYTLDSVNNFGGIGFQHTGTTSGGNRTLLESLELKSTKTN